MTILVTSNHRYELAILLAAMRRQIAREDAAMPARIGRNRANRMKKLMAMRRVEQTIYTSLQLVCRELGKPMVDVDALGATIDGVGV